MTKRVKYRLDDLIAGMNPEPRPEIDVGPPVGREFGAPAPFATPEEYAEVFAEGRSGHPGGVNPYLSFDGYRSLREQTFALAWECGWWAARQGQ
jgi:hypothetical protein